MEMYKLRVFGQCPRLLCEGYSLLPWGEEVLPGCGPVRTFCPRCEEVYALPPGHKASKLDGAFFGPSFAHAFVMCHALPRAKDGRRYVPKMHGFAVAQQRGRPSLLQGEELLAAQGKGSSASGARQAGLPLTTHYTGPRPIEDDFVSEDEAQPAAAASSGGGGGSAGGGGGGGGGGVSASAGVGAGSSAGGSSAKRKR